MRVTILHMEQGGARVHAAGCADIKRRDRKDSISCWTIDAVSQQDAANDAWSDFVGEGSMTEAGALECTEILPCAGELA